MEATQPQDFMQIVSTFSDSEISEMENIFRDIGKDSLNQEFYQDLATSFSSSHCRIGKPSITWQQVQSWFQDKLKDSNFSADGSISRKIPETTLVLKGGTAIELNELAFEAKSSRDNAWYDVGTFLNYRIMCTGELEARIRFADFSHSHDEWVNVRNGVRERSVPLDPSECHKVKVGDSVLCFQERPEHAVYIDAHIMEIQRRLHDINGCRCIYVVRFDEDKTQEKVQLNKICWRPPPSATQQLLMTSSE